MKGNLENILKKQPNQKAKDLARAIGVTRNEVNVLLHQNLDVFTKDDDFCWSVIETSKVTLELEANTWVTVDSFESSLANSGCLFSNEVKIIEIKFSQKCRPLIEAIARILALINQLSHVGKEVRIDFCKCNQTKYYLNRCGFFDLLDPNVKVSPNRPKTSMAKLYKGNADSLVEFGEIDPKNPITTLPKRLKNTFVDIAGIKYSDAAFTFFSELFDNVCEHSQSELVGFAAIQSYKGSKPHIQAIVSDSGIGIVGTLKPKLRELYPELLDRLDPQDPYFDVLLVKEVLEKGRITQTGCPKDTGRGLGLKRNQEFAVQYNADISVRQSDFELKLFYKDGCLFEHKFNINLPKIMGTHICFDYYID